MTVMTKGQQPLEELEKRMSREPVAARQQSCHRRTRKKSFLKRSIEALQRGKKKELGLHIHQRSAFAMAISLIFLYLIDKVEYHILL
jgi:hypothetical protein